MTPFLIQLQLRLGSSQPSHLYRLVTDFSEAGQNSTYHGEYVFYEEDTIYTVDGFAYFAVYTDIIQQVSLPLQLDELPTTYTEFESPTTEIDLF